MKKIILFLTVLGLSSCGFFLKKYGGISNPKFETYHSLNVYASSLGIDSNQVVFIKDTSGIRIINQMFGGSPEVLIFGADKKYYPYKNEGVACNAPIDMILGNICKADQMQNKANTIVDFDKLIDCLNDHNNCLSKEQMSGKDYFVFFDYVKYFNGVNKTHIIPWTKLINEQKRDCRVKYIFIDFDYLNNWGLTKKDLPKMKIRT